MKTTINILRSILTSFFFLILILAVTIQFMFTTIRINNKTIPDLVSPETILKMIKLDKELDPTSKEYAISYIDEYINYVFYKRSFPSIQEYNYKDISDNEKQDVIKLLTDIRNKIDMDYKTVVVLRDINNFLSNGSIYLLINIGTLIVILLILISSGKIPLTLKLTGASITLAGLITLLLSTVGTSLLYKNLDPLASNFVKTVFNSSFLKKIFNQSLIYITIGFTLFIVVLIINRYLLKKQTQN